MTDIAPTAATRTLKMMVRLYQAARAGRPSPCRFWPSCSEYALDALDAHGALRGTWLAVRRVGRCHPWGGHGVDPVPMRSADPGGGPGSLGPVSPVGSVGSVGATAAFSRGGQI